MVTTFGETLRRLRTGADLTAEQLAERSGLHAMSVYALERGSCSPTLHTARRLAKALGVGLSKFEDCNLPAFADRPKRTKVS
jgi:transcriptional regulator with XRE-family HTH domain